MRCRDAKNRLIGQRASHLARPEENEEEKYGGPCSPGPEQLEPLVTSSSHMCPGISTERIMQAVDRQRRITQQLDDLRVQQKQRTAFLRVAGLKLVVAVCYASGILGAVFVILLLLRPEMLAQTLDLLGNGVAALLIVEEDIKLGLSLIPSSSWLLSGVALVAVLMMGLWVHLMRHPQEV